MKRPSKNPRRNHATIAYRAVEHWLPSADADSVGDRHVARFRKLANAIRHSAMRRAEIITMRG